MPDRALAQGQGLSRSLKKNCNCPASSDLSRLHGETRQKRVYQMWSGRRVVAPPPPPSPHLSPRPRRRGCPASALLAAHAPGLVGLRALDPLVARQLRLSDGADDDDARALDEDREEDAYQRLGEGNRGGVLEAEQCGDDGEEGGADGEGDEAQPRALRDLVAEPADVCEALDLVGPERVEGGAALRSSNKSNSLVGVSRVWGNLPTSALPAVSASLGQSQPVSVSLACRTAGFLSMTSSASSLPIISKRTCEPAGWL